MVSKQSVTLTIWEGSLKRGAKSMTTKVVNETNLGQCETFECKHFFLKHKLQNNDLFKKREQGAQGVL